MILNKRSVFSLTIANIKVLVNCSDYDLAVMMRNRYHEFQSNSESEVDLYAEVEWVGKRRQSSMLDNTKVTFQDGILFFMAPGYRGYIDEKRGEGKLQLSTALPAEDIDYYIRVVFALLARTKDGILLHAAGIIRNDNAYLFFGHSGSGKTTVCRVSSANHTILNDDLILLLPEGTSWRAFGTPFSNPTQMKPTPGSAPIASMYLLTQAKHVAIYDLTTSQAIAALLGNIPVITEDPVRSAQVLDTLIKIQQVIPVKNLYFLPDNSFWKVIS
jgi:hypothetical protein